MQLPRETPTQVRRTNLDPEGKFPHPLVACLAEATVSPAEVDVFPMVVRAQQPDELHLPDYDLIVSFGQPINGAQAPVIVFGPVGGQRLACPEDFLLEASFHGSVLDDGYSVETRETQLRSLIQVPLAATPWRDLLKEGLQPAISANLGNLHTIQTSDLVIMTRDSEPQIQHWLGPEEALTPLLKFQDGTVIAAMGLTAERFPILFLPSWTPNKRAWLLTAWREWVADGTIDAPPPSEGFDDAAWMTGAELRELEEIHRLELDLQREKERLGQAIAAAKGRLAEASEAAESGARRLLTKNGEDLELAVEEALSALGFEVTLMNSDGVAKLEDLRVSTSSGTWTALVEVKGYSKAGKSNDFQKFARYSSEYSRQTNMQPDAYWYVVNAYMGQPPAARPGPFESVQDHVQTFSEEGGLVIPTAELFRLVRSVEAGVLTTGAAQASLTSQRGLYSTDSLTHEASDGGTAE